jgi:tetratricopeptide (TPR) repeat protein
MRRIFSGLLAVGISLTSSIIAPLAIPLALGQAQNPQTEEVKKLLEQAKQQTQEQKHQQAIEIFQKALEIARQVKDKDSEAETLVGIGFNLGAIGQPQEALNYYNQALPIRRAVGNRSGEATTLSNMGVVYSEIGRPQEALNYYNQALLIRRAVGDRPGEATTLSNMGVVYSGIGQPQEALNYYNQALPIRRAVGDRSGEAATLNNIGLVYSDLGQPQEALNYYNQALPIRRAVGDRFGEATTLSNIGLIYSNFGQPQEALNYYNQALPIRRAVGDRSGEATTLTNIGLVYSDLGQPQEALNYYNQALPIVRAVGDRSGEATTLTNIGGIYHNLGQSQQALNYYNQALPIVRAVGDRSGEATTLSNIGAVYRDTNRPTEAIETWEQSIKLTLQIRSGLLREQRQAFVQAKEGEPIALVSLLVERQQAKRAYQWLNLTATAELADYTRLLNAKVANPEAQAAIDAWNRQNQQLQALRQRLDNKNSDDLARQVRSLEAEVYQVAETIARRFPETAELFETTPADIAQLQANIPVGTTVIHPVLLTNIRNVPDTIAFFILTHNQLQVVKTAVDPKAFNTLLTTTAEQLTNRNDANEYLSNLAALYDQLIRPIEPQIQATQPNQLSIIATGKLRYLPFEALYDQKDRPVPDSEIPHQLPHPPFSPFSSTTN